MERVVSEVEETNSTGSLAFVVGLRAVRSWVVFVLVVFVVVVADGVA